jgi:heat shock protein HslJ
MFFARTGALCLTLAVLTPAPALADFLVAGLWRIVEVGGTVVPYQPPATLRLDAQGQASGSSGCNRFTVAWTNTGMDVTFGPVAATRMACHPAAMDIEAKLFDALERADRMTFDPMGGLVLLADGTPVARLNRSISRE